MSGKTRRQGFRYVPHAPSSSTSPSRYVSIAEAAQRTSVSRDTIRRMIADGQLPAYRFRGQVHIAVEDIDKAMHPIK
ncbi:DNA-binding protein [Nocardia nova]|uniref:DNA-binding protein n=1 Tax=Nocardia nova TaxID=37330 RepID=A0A2S5ZYL9_9NOCA|nr:excisionase family DNA-binding protein [Nocardia nova]PPJ23279.1 DNA-binding protein [Nocardia nova]